MKTIFLAPIATSALVVSQAHADDTELPVDTKRMLAYGTLSVMTGSCKTNITSAQAAAMKTGLQKAANVQKEMTQEQFAEAMKTVGTQVGQNREQICSTLTPDFINSSLDDAAAGN